MVDLHAPDLDALRAARMDAESALAAAKNRLEAAPSANDGKEIPCPHCKAALIAEKRRSRGGDLSITLKLKSEGLTHEERRRRRLSRVDLEADVRDAEDAFINATEDLEAAIKRADEDASEAKPQAAE